MTGGATVKVRILEHRSVLISGRQHGAGEEAEVPTAEAKTLIAEGYAEPTKTRHRAVAR